MASKVQTSSPVQEAEIETLKDKHGKLCKVIKDVGDFKNVVIIRPTDMDVILKFQLTAAYPDEIPSVVVRSDTIAIDCMPEISCLVEKTKQATPGKPVIDIIVQKVLEKLKSLGLDSPPQQQESTRRAKTRGKGKKSKASAHKPEADAFVSEKKPSMKTAEDVINRIQWDDSLQAEDFLVGYLDRFTGIVEKAFNAFSWEDLASIDYTVLGVPKHRIQYFKYKEVIVWDKSKRLDYVYGSVGKSITIHDVIENYELYKSTQPKQTPASHHSINASDSSDEEDNIGIDVTYQRHNHPGEEGQHSESRLRPTHFICVPITNPEVREGVVAMHDAILEKEPRYASCCIPPARLHLTLCTVGLDDTADMEQACTALDRFKPDFTQLLKHTSSIRIEGVDNFYDRVIYARAHHDIYFTQFVDHLRHSLKDAGVEIRDNHGYVPHVTIMKVSREISREMKTSKVDSHVYDWFSNMYFGTQSVDEIHLCEMSEARDTNGFYKTIATIKIQH